jgi:hypothetical protein
MVFPYIGALEAWIYTPIFASFGVSALGIRLPAGPSSSCSSSRRCVSIFGQMAGNEGRGVGDFGTIGQVDKMRANSSFQLKRNS